MQLDSAYTKYIEDYDKNTSRCGWKTQEEEMLWDEVEKARKKGRALKSVFDIIATQTGRKPNSVRNYYYSKAKEKPSEYTRNISFVPFSKEEIWQLLTHVLSEQGKGISVRACTLAMAKGDTSAMLRYQNKYRSLIKTNPVLVKQVIESMEKENLVCYNPYLYRKENFKFQPQSQIKTDDNVDEKTPKNVLSEIVQLLKFAAEVENARKRIQELEEIISTLENKALENTFDH